MYKSDTSGTGSSGGGGTRDECCTDVACASGQRNNYYEGKRLTPDSFRAEQDYLVERRRLLNRAMFGWGVVYGYAVAAEAPHEGPKLTTFRKLRIDTGLALDACGRELLQVGTVHLRLDDLIVVDEKGQCIDRDKAFAAADPQGYWRLEAHYAERSSDPVTVADACRCDRDEWDRVCETVRYTLRSVARKDCCVEVPCELKCNCGPCCEPEPPSQQPPKDYQDKRFEPEILQYAPARPHRRGGCSCLCDHLMKIAPGADCKGVLCPIDDSCGHVEVDLGNGVALACLRIVRDYECNEWAFTGVVEACGPRRLVKRNDLLFDLIRGCDLTRIAAIGWADWHLGEVSYEEFSAGLGPIGKGQSHYVTTKFFVRFTGPVRKRTLRAHCFAMTVMFFEGEGGWWWARRVPIIGVEMMDEDGKKMNEDSDPDGHAWGARLVVEGRWADDAVCGTRHLFQGGPAIVEIEIRGDFIIDCNGQAIDANAIGTSVERTGNGTPGGTFISSFRVQQQVPRPSPGTYGAGQGYKGAQS